MSLLSLNCFFIGTIFFPECHWSDTIRTVTAESQSKSVGRKSRLIVEKQIAKSRGKLKAGFLISIIQMQKYYFLSKYPNF